MHQRHSVTMQKIDRSQLHYSLVSGGAAKTINAVTQSNIDGNNVIVLQGEVSRGNSKSRV
ncbi:hypothetical protein QCE62_14700 [Caballeronia sp. LZ033]|uniref:hypothetical protein n=1 Tax=Caballeronia sp. LZ033 TaxID=3038566 RepID=UPI0028675558|nr:hypothetical protein [Caballeronia sp. LZ033]MDR5814832.1 hypothetical protein [Caballeronia sp. LZ033]